MYNEFMEKLVENLDWNTSLKVQENALNVLSRLDKADLSLIFDKKKKYIWLNYVKLVDRVGYPKNKELLHNLIWLLKDINWPGSYQAIDVLKKIKKEEVITLIENAIQLAYNDEDTMWLGGLKRLVEEADYNRDDFVNANVIEMLSYADF